MPVKKDQKDSFFNEVIEGIGIPVVIEFCINLLPGMVSLAFNGLGMIRSLIRLQDRTADFLVKTTLSGTILSENQKRNELIRLELERAKCAKRQNRHKEALTSVNTVLALEPEFPEALFLKSRILWEGFDNAGAAQAYLEKLMCLPAERDDQYHRWGSNLYDELSRLSREE